MITQQHMPKLAPLPLRTKGLSPWGKLRALATENRRWILLEDWLFKLPNGKIIVIPEGFILDGASVPKPLWFLLSPIGILLIPAIIHDYAYAYDYLWLANGEKYQEGAGQAFWDELFKRVSYEVNGMVVVDTLAYYALRAFGCFAWSNARFKNEPELFPRAPYFL